MARDDRRMHGSDTPGLVPGRGHERHEEPVRLGEREPGAPTAAAGSATTPADEPQQGATAMTSGKHDEVPDEGPFTSDLENDPGIGQSKGLFATGEDPDLLEGVTTQEGDVENQAAPSGAVDEHKLGRTNK